MLAAADVFDLDRVEVDELRADLEQHLTGPARRRAALPGAVRAAGAERLAQVVADRLAHGSRDWGRFLVPEW